MNYIVMRLTSFITFIILSGCTVHSEVPVDAGTSIFPDVPVVACQYDAGIENDFNNCGSCGYACPYAITDRCRMNECLCGNSPPCDSETEECRFGVCRPSDPNGVICEFDGECGASNSGFGCIRGRCSRIECTPEICDNLDNDCDGDIDGDSRGPLSRWCYEDDLPVSSVLNSPCERGVQVCYQGFWDECIGAIPPRAEIGTFACDGIDNDCDTCIDGVMTSDVCVSNRVDGFDVVYIIDISGSMSSEIEAVRDATNEFTTIFGSDPTFRFGLLIIPGMIDATVSVVSDLVPFTDFTTVLASDFATFGGGSEPSYDAVYLLGMDDELRIGWRDNTIRIIILFTDEEGQSYRRPPVSEETMCNALTHGEIFTTVVPPGYYNHFDMCGTYFELTTDPLEMANSLRDIIRNPCVSMP